jgi:RHS repeat-associated protein
VASIDSSNMNGTSVAYAWDAANQLVSVTDNRLSGETTAAYTSTGRPLSLAQPNGVSATYAYDSLDRVLSMAWKKAAAPAFASWAYSYNPRGQRLTSTGVTGREATYGYDTASRLASETITGDPSGAVGNGALIYSSDPVGNRLARVSTLAALGAQSLSYDTNDELTTDSYDLNGNTISSSSHTYGYDFENRLVSKDSGAVTVLYDGDGNRVSKTAAGVTTKYLVDDLNPTGYLQVMDEVSAGAVQVRYTFGNMLVSQTRNPSTSPTTSFYGYDAQRNITFLTDATGAVTNSYDFDAWGNLIASTGSTPNTRLYTGQEFDSDLGLINLRARQYRPDTGRFLTLDPLMGEVLKPTSLNKYLYADGDPIKLWDPTGKQDDVEEGGTSAPAIALEAPKTIAIGYLGKAVIATTVAAAVGWAIDCALAYAGSPLGPNPAGSLFSVCSVEWCRLQGQIGNSCSYRCDGDPPGLQRNITAGPQGCAQQIPKSWMPK